MTIGSQLPFVPKLRHTKKQKIKTSLRKVAKVISKTSTPELNTPIIKPAAALPEILVTPTSYIVTDLKKTITLSLIIIAVSLVLYFQQDQLFKLLEPMLK